MDKVIKDLLERAANKLQDYCAEVNDDMNDSLATEISAYLESQKPVLPSRRDQIDQICQSMSSWDYEELLTWATGVRATLLSKQDDDGVYDEWSNAIGQREED